MRSEKRNKKTFSLIALLAIAVMLFAIGSTLAYLADKTPAIENTFTPSKAGTEIEEEFDGKVKTDVKVKNTGDIDAYIRATVVITWQNEAGDILGTKPVEGTDYAMTQTLTGWKEIDGIYYYQKKVASGESTDVLIDRCEPLKEAPVDGYTLHVEILAEAIQADPDTAIKEAWGINPATWTEVSK